jgi:hypothetical protein
MPASATPVRSTPEGRKRAQRIFARLIAGEAMRAVAAAENLSLRRVQQIVREQLDRRDANPADDFALLQIARLERRSISSAARSTPASRPPRTLSSASSTICSASPPTGCVCRAHPTGFAMRSTRWKSGSAGSTRRGEDQDPQIV